MKYLSRLLSLSLLLSFFQVNGQDITIYGQVGLDNFDQSITTISGNLHLNSTNTSNPISDLSNLSNIESIGGNLIIESCEALTSTIGFSNLMSIGGNLEILVNGITDVEGFSNLTTLNGELEIRHNGNLTNIGSFNSNLTIGGDVDLYYNLSLNNLGGILDLGMIAGELQIQFCHNLTTLESFPNLQTIGGIKIYNNNSLEDIDGFPILHTINGSLKIEQNQILSDIGGFSNLQTITGSLVFYKNHLVTTLYALQSIQTIGAGMLIYNNDSLLRTSSFPNLQSVGGLMMIKNNKNMIKVGPFSNLHTVSGDLEIENLDNLKILNGFSSLHTTGGIYIRNHDKLETINAFLNLPSTFGDFDIRYNPNLVNIHDFMSLESVGRLIIQENDQLVDINCFSYINTVDEDLEILSNQNLQNLDGLANVQTIGNWIGDLRIAGNSSLTNIDGLLNCTFIDNLFISNNPLLEDCCILQHVLSSNIVDWIISIFNNGVGCSSESEILSLTDCNTCVACPDIYVDHTANGSNDGSSWANAFNRLEDALNVGMGKNIHMAQGIYLPTSSPTERVMFFDMPTNSTLLGGYPNGGAASRNPATYRVFLNGDIDGDAGPSGNSYHIIRLVNVSNVVVDGVTIQNGNADNATSFARSRGGGVFSTGSTSTFTNVRFKWNRAIYGGAVFATLSPNIIFEDCEFSNNTADFGSCMYHSNETKMYLNRVWATNNNALVRSQMEANNSLYTRIENSVFANNQSDLSNGLAFIATTRDASADIYNTTILGGSKNRFLITAQIGFGDQLDINIYNSIIAHQDASFTKVFLAHNNNIYNLNTYNCYVQGSSVMGNASNNLYEDVTGPLILNADYSLDACSPGVNAGNNTYVESATDMAGNPRIFGTVDMGAYEANTSCGLKLKPKNTFETRIFPNPTLGKLSVQTDIENVKISIFDIMGNQILYTQERELDISAYPLGVYILNIESDGGVISNHKIIKN